MSADERELRLVGKCANYLRAIYGEELVEYVIVGDDVAQDSGKLTMDCVVRTGGGKSRWQKTFTFDRGDVADMTWRYLG